MTDLPAGLRDDLAGRLRAPLSRRSSIAQVSADGTRKYLLQLATA